MRAAVTVACLAIALPAHAQPPGLTPPGLTPALEPQPQPLRRQKDRGTAVLASIGGTVVPLLVMMTIGESTEPEKNVVLFGVTAVLLPSAGHWYAGKFLTTGMGIRLGGGLLATLGIAALANDDDGTTSAAPALLGLAALGVGAVWDIATAPSAVDAWNRKHATVLTATPMKLGTGYGVGLAGGLLMRAAIIVAIAISSSVATAQPPSLTPMQAPPHTSTNTRPPKQRAAAYALSALGSVAPLAVMAAAANNVQPVNLWLLTGAAAILLPSAGHWYAHRPFTLGMGIRVVGVGLAVSTIVSNETSDGGADIAGPIMLGLVSFSVGATLDVMTAGSAVDRWNRKHATVVAPMPVGTGYGLGIAGQL